MYCQKDSCWGSKPAEYKLVMNNFALLLFENLVEVLVSSKHISTPPLTSDYYKQLGKGSVKSYDPSVNQSNDRSFDDLDVSLAHSISQPAVKFPHANLSMSVTPSMKSQDTEANMRLTETNVQLVKTLEAMMKAMDNMEKRNGI